MFSQFFNEIKFSEYSLISSFYNFFILLFIIIFLLTIKKEPLHRSPDANKILNFIESNNAQKYYSDFNSEWLLSFVRSFNNKEIFVDYLWIFDEKVSLQWLELKEKGNKIRNLKDYNLIEFKCELNKNNVDAYIK